MNRDEAKQKCWRIYADEHCRDAGLDWMRSHAYSAAFDAGYQAGSEGRLADEHRKVSEAYQHGYDDGEKEGYERAKQED